MINDYKCPVLEHNLPFLYDKILHKINIICKIIKILWIFFINSTKYLFYFDNDKLIKDIALSLALENPIYVKLFQSICVNCSLFNCDQIEYLIEYTDNIPYSESEIDYDFMTTLTEIGIENPEYNIDINPLPINVGTIGIVFNGTLGESNNKKENKEVIVKVMKKNIHQKLVDALTIGSYIVNIFYYLPFTKHLNIKNIYKQNYESLIQQTDFYQELNNINIFKNLNKNIDYVVIPKTYDFFTKKNKNIIVMDYIVGDKITSICPYDYEIYGKLLNKFAVKAVAFDGVFHADLHAGNILFIKEKNKNNNEYSYKLGLIDFGIIGRLTREEQNVFYEFFKNMFGDKIDYNELAVLTMKKLVETETKINNLSQSEYEYIIKNLECIYKYSISIKKDFNIDDIYKINYLLSKYSLRLKDVFFKIQLSFFITMNINNYFHIDSNCLDNTKIACKDLFNMDILTC